MKIRRSTTTTALVYTLLYALVCFCAAAPSDVRCFVGQFAPTSSDAPHTRFTYDIDTITPVPIELTLPVLEFSAVLNDRCTWSTRVDALMLNVNGVLASYWPTHCSESSPMLFGVGTNAPMHWGSHPRSPYNSDALYETQNGRIDLRTATWSVLQRPARNRTLELSMFSGSELRFMPAESAAAPPLYVRVCMLARQVPNDWSAAPGNYHEVSPPGNTVYPLSSCVYEHAGRCGAQLGYVSTALDGSAVVLRRHGSHNYLEPSSVENGWTLPSAFPSGLRDPGVAPHMHAGWRCEDGETLRWYLNGSVMRINAQSRRCASTVYTAEDERYEHLRFGVTPYSIAALKKPAQVTAEHKVSIETANRYWSLHHVDVPVLAERNDTSSAVGADASSVVGGGGGGDGDDQIYR